MSHQAMIARPVAERVVRAFGVLFAPYAAARKGIALLAGVVLVAGAVAPARGGWAGLYKYLYGPNEEVIMEVGSIDFYPADFWGNCTACPPTGQCDSWAGVNITALVYVVRHDAVSGTEHVALDPLKVIPERQLVQPSSTSGFIDEPIEQTGPDGPLLPGTYDIIFDECEDHYFDPDKDAIVATFMVGYVNIEFIDPNPDLLADGEIITDWDTLGTYVPDAEINQLVADGVTRLLLRVPDLPESGDVTFRLLDDGGQLSSEIGTLGEVGSTGGGSEITVSAHEMSDGSFTAFAVLTGPVDFVAAVGGENSPSRSIQVQAEYQPSSGGEVPPGTESAVLYRPPVVLVHGLWSSAGTWGWEIQSDPRFPVVYAVDYSGTHADHFIRNVDKPRKGIETAVDTMRLMGIAATQADVFGHSMGGLLSRMYASNMLGDYIRDDNYRAGDIHKLITVDTPHFGSPLADYLLDEDGHRTLIGRILSFLGCMECGAVSDLKPDSPAITGLRGVSLPVHAIAGKGGSDAMEAALIGTLPSAGRIILTVLDFFGVLGDVFPPAYQHDVIVGRLSQEGGLGTGSPATSIVGLDLLVPSYGIHTTVTHESYVSDIAADLLVAPTDSSQFASGFGGGSPRPAPAPNLPDWNTRDDALAITSPAAGTTIEPGQPLSVTVEPLGDYVPARVLVVCAEDAVIDEEAPFEVTLDITPDAIGELTVQAYAFDANEVMAEATPVSVTVVPNATLTSLRVLPVIISLYGYAPTQQLQVIGQFDDGVERDVTAAVLGTTYESSDTCRLTVNAEGLLTGHHTGYATVQIANGPISRTVWVHVAGTPGDFDADGDVDLGDLSSLLAAYGTCVGDETFNPDADLDRSGCVDLADLSALLAVYGTSCP